MPGVCQLTPDDEVSLKMAYVPNLQTQKGSWRQKKQKTHTQTLPFCFIFWHIEVSAVLISELELQSFALLGTWVGAMGLRYHMTFIDEVNPDAVQKRSESCPPVMRHNYDFQAFLPITFVFFFQFCSDFFFSFFLWLSFRALGEPPKDRPDGRH